MAWRVIGTNIRNFFLALLEYVCKINAFLGACIAVSSGPSFVDKVIAGCSSVIAAFQTLPEIYQRVTETANVIHDYNTLEASAFTELHGPSAVDGVMRTLNEATLYLYGIEQNITNAPLSTAGAGVLVFALFFGAAWMLRIIRQGADDLFWVRKEKKVWRRIFADKDETPETKTEEKPASAAARQQQDVIPELEVEEHWNVPSNKQAGEPKDDSKAGTTTQTDHITGALALNGKKDGDIKEFDDISEGSQPRDEQQDNAESHDNLPNVPEDEDTPEQDQFDLESELKSAMEDNAQQDESGDEDMEHDEGHVEQSKPHTDNTDSEKSSYSTKKKHSLDEFLEMARSST